MSESSMIEVKNVTKSFFLGAHEVSVLKGLSFSVRKGEFVALMGASGSGKSTLLHLLAGLSSLDQGEITLDGLCIHEAAVSDRSLSRFRRRHIGLVFQTYNLVPSLTLEENMMLPLHIDQGEKKGDLAKLKEVIALLQLEGRETHLPMQLSGGEQQRVAIGRSLMLDAPVILADEPTGNLDSVSSDSIMHLFRALCEEKKRTVLLVTHEMSAAYLADRTLILKDGVVVDEVINSELKDMEELSHRYLQATQQGGKA